MDTWKSDMVPGGDALVGYALACLEATIVEIKTVGAATTTRLEFTAENGNAKVKDSEVDPALLFQLAEK